ncbi:hypothetical protein ACWDO7_22875 [Streptomyces sp. NPDC003656]|uniref:hypothetical protein n=1 Tax=Streptomyces sp. NPDC091385 TaxID=3365997 RepID=UPI0037F6DC90
MDSVEIAIHGPITHGAERTAVRCPVCGATQAHTVRGHLGDDTTPVTLTCINGHDVPVPDEIDARQLLFTAAMRAE